MLAPSAIGPVDAVLLSHDQHPDNLDRLGRTWLASVPLVLSTAGRARLGGSVHLTGEVTGFALAGEGPPTVYVSGDNASLEVVRAIADRYGRVDIALLFAGGAQTALLGDAYLTLTSDAAAEAARILGARQAVPVHFEGWTHFTQGADTLLASFEQAGLAERLHLLKPGEQIRL